MCVRIIKECPNTCVWLITVKPTKDRPMTTRSILSVGFLTAILTGCAATGPRYSEVTSPQSVIFPSHARLIVFRTKESSQYSGRAAAVKIDGGSSGSCDYGGFNTFDVAAGKHIITVDMWDSPGKCELPIEVSGGASYFFEVQPRLGNLLSVLGAGLVGASIESAGQQCGGAFSISPVEENAALSKLTDLRATR